MARTPRILTLGLLSFASFGCIHHYTPTVSLPESSETIVATVEVRQFVEAPLLAKPDYAYGLVAPRVKTMRPGDLASQISEVVRQELLKNRVFSAVSFQSGDADFILTGTIEQFSENYQPKLWPLVAPLGNLIAWMFQLQTYVVNAEAAITVRLSRRDGGSIEKYHGYAALLEETRPTAEDPPGRRLNQVFSSVILQIREQLIAVHSKRLS